MDVMVAGILMPVWACGARGRFLVRGDIDLCSSLAVLIVLALALPYLSVLAARCLLLLPRGVLFVLLSWSESVQPLWSESAHCQGRSLTSFASLRLRAYLCASWCFVSLFAL